MTSRTKLKRKEVDDVLGGEEMWKHADSTTGALIPESQILLSFVLIRIRFVFGLWSDLVASCPRCNNNQAYFYQLQIRSADEPMTTCMRILLKGSFSAWFFY
jgi:hypothetical protein